MTQNSENRYHHTGYHKWPTPFLGTNFYQKRQCKLLDPCRSCLQNNLCKGCLLFPRDIVLLLGTMRRCGPSQTPDFTVIFSIVTVHLVFLITLLITPHMHSQVLFMCHSDWSQKCLILLNTRPLTFTLKDFVVTLSFEHMSPKHTCVMAPASSQRAAPA